MSGRDGESTHVLELRGVSKRFVRRPDMAGRIARALGATSEFGKEYDSLADVISFGVAPAFLLYSFALRDLGRPAWFAAFLFVICGALRLARFNVITGSSDKRYFVGLPIPAGAAQALASALSVPETALRAEPTRLLSTSYAVFCLKNNNQPHVKSYAAHFLSLDL